MDVADAPDRRAPREQGPFPFLPPASWRRDEAAPPPARFIVNSCALTAFGIFEKIP